jgi:hypothetical protein
MVRQARIDKATEQENKEIIWNYNTKTRYSRKTIKRTDEGLYKKLELLPNQNQNN